MPRWSQLPVFLALLILSGFLVVRVWPGLNFSPTAAGSISLADVRAADSSVVHGSWYDLAFTQPSAATGGARSTSALEQSLVGLMDRAQNTLDVAVYEIDLGPVADAMARAEQRGVQVRMVTDTDTLTNTRNPSTKRVLDELRGAGVPIVDDQRRPIMHHKFAVVDGRWVETGSWNFTFSETYRNNNYAILIDSPQLAANYTAEFEKMFVAHQFGPRKTRGVPFPVFDLGGGRLESYFSPEDSAGAQIIRWLGAARQDIHFLAFAFTHNGIADAMLQRAQVGVEVSGVFEASDALANGSQYPRLKQAGLGVILDRNPWAMHDKLILIDGHIAILGSFNFSRNADRENDENLLIVDDPNLTGAFEAEYQRIRSQALGATVPAR
ncbi:MAG TPA: phospholipase D-like domain-containing protein [Chloroflexota bacterium]